MDTTPGTARHTPAVPSRRVLLRVGGLVILTGLAVTEPVRPSPAAARTPGQSPGPRRSAGTAASRSARRHNQIRSDRDLTRAGEEQIIYYIHDGPRAIALTIDDGPSPIYTPQILRLLHRYRVTAAFSMIGVNVDAYPGVAREVADAGHMIVNHTWAHPDLAFMSPGAVWDEMARATDAIHRVTGRHPHMFRAPYGAWSPTVLQWCERLRMAPLDWSVDPRDWSLPGVAAIVDNIMDNTRTGSIILEHDGGGNRSETVAALRIVLPRLLAGGFHFRTP